MLAALGIPVWRCGALMASAPEEVERNAGVNGVPVRRRADGTLEIPGESVTDPVAYVLALGAAAAALGATIRTGFRVCGIDSGAADLVVHGEGGERLTCDLAVNCGGLHADDVARLVGDEDFAIYPRKGEFLVFAGKLDRILLPVPTKRTKGVLVFPTLDEHVIAGPTAVDGDDKRDWSVRPQAVAEVRGQAEAMYPLLRKAELVGIYAGLRPAGRDGENYLIGPSKACERLVNVAAIRSTGLSASLGIAEYVSGLIGDLGAALGNRRPLPPASRPIAVAGPWWRRTAAVHA